MSTSDAIPAASAATPHVLLAHHLKALKLPTFLSEYAKLAQECAQEGAVHARYLLRLAELELISRERRMVERRIRAARFPAVKSFDTFDFTAIPAFNKMLTLELARCEYAVRRENIVALGPAALAKPMLPWPWPGGLPARLQRRLHHGVRARQSAHGSP